MGFLSDPNISMLASSITNNPAWSYNNGLIRTVSPGSKISLFNSISNLCSSGCTLRFSSLSPEFPKLSSAVNFEKLGSKSVTIIVESNSNGEWFLAQKVELSSGEWTARARILGDPASDWSSPRIIRSTVSGFIFGSIKIKYFPIAIALILLLLSSTALLAYLLWQISKVRRSAHLREDISDELEHLEKAIREGKELSESEMKRRENLLLELRHAEEIIQDKFKEI